jgi:hypothetical protein
MKKFIKNRITEAYTDFCKSAEHAQKLCELKKFTYAGTSKPDYANPMVQQYYILKYFPAYLAEYRVIYERIFSFNFLGTPLKVLSIGTGCGTDLYGLHFAATKSQLQGLIYTGIDCIKWQYQNQMGHNGVRFIQADIQSWSALDRDDYNIIIFPKSISEFSEKCFSYIKSLFEKTSFAANKIVLICSLMGKGKEADFRRVTAIVKIFQSMHYTVPKDDLGQYLTSSKSEGLRNICSDFIYPDNILTEFKKILHKCLTYSKTNRACEEKCEQVLKGKFPVLKTDYIKYKILRLEKQ